MIIKIYCDYDDGEVDDDYVVNDDDDDDGDGDVDNDDDEEDNDDIGGLSKGAQATYEPRQLNGEPPINLALSSWLGDDDDDFDHDHDNGDGDDDDDGNRVRKQIGAVDNKDFCAILPLTDSFRCPLTFVQSTLFHA